MKRYLREQNSSEAKSSDDTGFSEFWVARVWLFYSVARDPWTYAQVFTPPSMLTKGGYKTVITQGRFRCFIIGGTNSRQNWEFNLERKAFRPRAQMIFKRAYFSFCVKQDQFVYAIGGRGDTQSPSFYSFVRS